MSPASGPCSEFTANDIGVSQSNSTSADESLQKTGTGSVSSDFTWVGPVAKTKGAPFVFATGPTQVKSELTDPVPVFCNDSSAEVLLL